MRSLLDASLRRHAGLAHQLVPLRDVGLEEARERRRVAARGRRALRRERLDDVGRRERPAGFGVDLGGTVEIRPDFA